MGVRAEELEEGSGGGCGCGAHCVPYLSTCVVCSNSPGQMIEQYQLNSAITLIPFTQQRQQSNILWEGDKAKLPPKVFANCSKNGRKDVSMCQISSEVMSGGLTFPEKGRP